MADGKSATRTDLGLRPRGKGKGNAGGDKGAPARLENDLFLAGSEKVNTARPMGHILG